MKIYVHHDKDCNISSLIVGSAPKGVELRLTPEPGLQVGEVEGLTVKDARDIDALREIVANHRVVKPGSRVKLAKKR